MESNYDVTDFTMSNDFVTEQEDDQWRNSVPRVNAVASENHVMDRNRCNDGRLVMPMHVVFNQAARLLRRYKKPIKGTQVQQSFVQRLVSTVYGHSFPLLYFHATIFPKHFWASATADQVTILGCLPISCYRGVTHPDGFASSLEQGRNLSTHSSSSTSTDDFFIAHLWDIQTNLASLGVDSRMITRHGFTVSNTNASGLKTREKDGSDLTETLDSGQGALNLAAASVKCGFDIFLTYTCNQSTHPGISHLFKWKESKEWTSFVKGYTEFDSEQQREVDLSMEMAYSNILT